MTEMIVPAIGLEAAPKSVISRSLWEDAWPRLRKNRAAVASAIYLGVVALTCIVGPNLTGHDFDTIYHSYVNVPPSFEPYPRASEMEADATDALKRARVDVQDVKPDGDRFPSPHVQNPIDPRVTRYLDRSDASMTPKSSKICRWSIADDEHIGCASDVPVRHRRHRPGPFDPHPYGRPDFARDRAACRLRRRLHRRALWRHRGLCSAAGSTRS